MTIRENRLSQIVKGIYAFLSVLILALLVVCDQRADYPEWARNQSVLPNVVLMPLGAALLAAVMAAWKRWVAPRRIFQRIFSDGFYGCLWGMSLLLLLLQVFLSYHLYFIVGWDVGIVTGIADGLQTGTEVIGDFYYFSQYPNNVGIVYLLAIVGSVASFFGLEGYYAYVLAGCAMVNLAGVLTALSIKEITGSKKAGLSAFLLFALLIGIHPWMVVPYTDAYSILFPILTLYLYLCACRASVIWKKGVFWFLTGLCGLCGYYIKPSAVIVLIAVLCLEGIALLVRKGYGRAFVFHLGMILLAFGASLGIRAHMLEYTGCDLQEDLRFSYTHYLMLGLNEENAGAYYTEDYAFSSAQPDQETRARENLRVAGERLRGYGPMGCVRFLGRKLLINYNDGMFAWEKEGVFEISPSWVLDTPVKQWVEKIFRKDAEWYPYYATFAQGCWVVTLFLGAAGALRKRREREHPIGEDVLYIALIGSFLFVMIFEARSRYLYNMTPVYLSAAALGLYRIYGMLPQGSPKEKELSSKQVSPIMKKTM